MSSQKFEDSFSDIVVLVIVVLAKPGTDRFKKIKKIQPRPKKMSINFCFRNKDEKLKCSTD